MNNLYFIFPLSVITTAFVILLNNLLLRKIAYEKCSKNKTLCESKKNELAVDIFERQFFILNSICLLFIILLPFVKNKTFNSSIFFSFIGVLFYCFYISWNNVDEKKMLLTLLFYLILFLILIGLNSNGIKNFNDLKII